MKFSVLGSGSSGNSSYIEMGNKKFLIDAGFSGKKIMEKLNNIERKIEENICKKEIINLEINLQEEIYNQRRKSYLIPNFFYKISLEKYQRNEDKVAENINSK